MTLLHDIVPAHLAVQAMRDNGYKNTAYALAELMDNAIQAGAKNVELLCGERLSLVQARERWSIHQIGVLDDGCGMAPDVLRIALQFGNGTRLDSARQDGIGKFGMGLPSSSISQCTKVEVWTWQDGPENAYYSYLDVAEIRTGRMREVPIPTASPVPTLWRQLGQSFGDRGTLVVWQNLDRVVWKNATTIIRNSEQLIGRMYRKFLHEGGVRIRLAAFDCDRPENGPREGHDRQAVPTDPLYLMATTSCPEPWRTTPMFEPWGEPTIVKIQHSGSAHDVVIRFSVAKDAARSGESAGRLPHGQHAARNQGISIVRAGRELDLETSWVIGYDPVERWWGVEVEFPPALDEVFGVSNNKQAARNFHQIDLDSLRQDGETDHQLLERLREEADPAHPLWEVSHIIQKNLREIRKLLSLQNRGQRRAKLRHENHEAERIATEQTQRRQREGNFGESDATENLPPETRTKEIAEDLTRQGVPENEAVGIAAQTVGHGLKYTIADVSVDTSAFFLVTPKAGQVTVGLNTAHPAYPRLVEVLEKEVEDSDAEVLRRRLESARDGLRLVLLAWARYEDELNGENRTRAQDTRADWGRVARGFLAQRGENS